jgi:hypothetical protein
MNHGTFSSVFPTIWVSTCFELLGRELPINFMDFDEEIGVGCVGFEVDEDAEPLQLLNGKAVRVVSINYVYDEVIYASTSRQ